MLKNRGSYFGDRKQYPYNRLFLWTACLVAALGGLLFGYDWVVISGADIFYEKFFHLTAASDIGWAKGCALVGCLAGSLVAGALSDRFGRKRLLILSALLFAVSSIGTGLANTFSVFVFWRIVGGGAIGLASNLSPVYIAEISPAAIRGKLVSMNQLNIVIGILLAQFVNWLVAKPVPAEASVEQIVHSWNGQYGWRWMFCLTAVPAVLFLLGMLFVPESPRWLVRNGQKERARAVLQSVGGEVSAERALIEIEASMVDEVRKVSFAGLLAPGIRRIVLLGVLLSFLVQWCGINVIFYYTKDVFAAAGYNVSAILLNILIVGTVNLIFTVLALQEVDRLGRRLLMLIGWAGLALIFIVMGLAFQSHIKGLPVVALVVMAIGCYAFTLAPVSWVVISEIFPNRIRGAGMAVAVFALWMGNFTLTYTFPTMLEKLGSSGTFWLFAAICGAGFIFTRVLLPETRGKTLEQIERELTK